MKIGLIAIGVIIGIIAVVAFGNEYFYGCSNLLHTCAVIKKPI